jgi:2-dehydropantoate 2-reductase
LIAAGVPTEISANVRGALWAKLILNCAYNAVSAIAQLPYGKTVQGVGVIDVMRDVVAECLAVARPKACRCRATCMPPSTSSPAACPTSYASTAQDLARGKPTEIDYLNGLVVKRGEALGVAVPANRVLWALVKLLEGKAAAA